MKPVLVLYATREGHTKKIAEHVGEELRRHGLEADVLNAADLPRESSLEKYETAVLAASVHIGKHEPEIVRFVKEHRDELTWMDAIFLSVSGAEATAEDTKAAPAVREASVANVNRAIEIFREQTGWRPIHVVPVAGALKFLEYGPIVRFMIKLIAKRSGTVVDTKRNTEFTDWEALDRFVGDWTTEVALIAEPAGKR